LGYCRSVAQRRRRVASPRNVGSRAVHDPPTAMAEIIHEKAFRKQGAVSLIGKVGRSKGRWFRNVGLGIKVRFLRT
jgi:hypothetical protein